MSEVEFYNQTFPAQVLVCLKNLNSTVVLVYNEVFVFMLPGKDDNALVPYGMVPSPEMDNFLEPVPQSNMVLRKRIRKIKQGMRR